MMDFAEPIPYTKQKLKAYREITLPDGHKLCDALHADVRQGCTVLQIGTYGLAADWFIEKIDSMDHEQLRKIGAAFNYIDNRLGPHSTILPNREQVQGAFSCAYHLFSDASAEGMRTRMLISQAASALGVELLPKKCLEDEDTRELLEAIIIQQARQK